LARHRCKVPRWAVLALPPLLLTIAAAILCAVLPLDVLTIIYGGLAGVMLPDPSVGLSVVKIGSSLAGASSRAGPAVGAVMQTLFFGGLVVSPLAWVLLLCVLWTVPLRLESQARLLAIAERAYAWSLHDVAFVTIICAAPQLPRYFAHLLANECAPINSLLASYFASFVKNDDTCLSVHAELPGPVALFGLAAVLSTAVGVPVMRAARATLVAVALA